MLMPPFWELREPLRVSWEEISSPDNQVQELACGGEYLFARTPNALWRRHLESTQWEQLNLAEVPIHNYTLPTGQLHSLDTDDNQLYIACQRGVVSSSDWGNNFSWEYYWSWDPTIDIDCQNGYCWSLIDNWGSRSGLRHKTPDGQWENKSNGVSWHDIGLLSRAVIDTVDPANVAYAGYYRTIDGGENWTSWSSRVDFSANDSGTPVLYNDSWYSIDHGETWLPLGVQATTFMADQESDNVFALSPPYGVRRGHLDNWHYYGLAGKDLWSICADDRYVFVSDGNGKIYRARIDAVDTSIVYHQGAPVNAQWTEDGNQLVLSISGTVSGLTIHGQVRLDPPQAESLTASVLFIVLVWIPAI